MTKARMLLDRQYTFLPWIAGGAWLFAGLVSLAREKPTHLLDAWMLAPIALTYDLLLRFAKEHHANLPRYGRLGSALLLGSSLPMLVGQIAAIFEWDSLTWLGFPFGLLGFAIGSALLGVGLARHAIHPSWIGYAIAVAQPASVLTGLALSPIRELSDYGSYTGAVAHGVIWIAIAYALPRRSEQAVPAPRSTPVSAEASA